MILGSLDDHLAVDAHADGFADIRVVEWLDGGVDVKEGAIPADEVIMEIGRVFGNIGLFDIRDEVAGPIQFAVGKRQVGSIVIGKGGIADALEGRLAGLPVVGVLFQDVDLGVELGHLGEGAGGDRVVIGPGNRVLDILPDMLGNDELVGQVIQGESIDRLEFEFDRGSRPGR